MDDMAAYYPPPAGLHYPYYPPPPNQPPLGAAQPQPQAVPQPLQYHPHQPLAYYPQPSYNDVRTLFVAGLPEDVKQREIYNLFREFPGYESSHLRTATSTSQPFAFAVFMDQQSAVAALNALNGMVFDLEKGSTLYIDLAKSNSRSKRSRTEDERPGSDKRFKGPAAFSWGGADAGVGSVHMPGMGNSAFNMIGYPPTQSPGNFDGRAINETTPAKSNTAAAHIAHNATPCPTLFVASLGPTCTEEELIQVFSRYPGFLKLKMQSTYGAPVAFVDFQTCSYCMCRILPVQLKQETIFKELFSTHHHLVRV
ncbi:RNA-binding protein L isoform X2 [Cornus florida]|uniref:RNA-binding protein L isoform X2 n=1 Tax=Cornus florida TaxID=4283 RepID=UPI002899634F|nr:RNA-binding protein L isoform X2 [Cornus florida]